MSDARTLALIDDLLKLPAETNWVEFKESNADPQMIGIRVSALANAARLADQHFAYMVWGVRDEDLAVVGTTFQPSVEQHQRQPLEFWLAQRLQPSLTLCFKVISHSRGRLVLLEIPAATVSPIEFDRTAYLRIGSATPRLSDYPERLRALWSKLQPYAWETAIAAQFVSGDDVLKLLDYARYFELTRQPLPDNRKGIFECLASDRLISPDSGGRWNVTNLGAILFAKKLFEFGPGMARKAVRFVAYAGSGRADTVFHRFDEERGYASAFDGLVAYIDALLPANEHIGRAFRTEAKLFPTLAIRELVANALIHQDMTISGSGPLIELFVDRIEITNPGQPLVSPERFIDSPPRSRNEALASLMRRMRLCEEQGTGIDKVVAAVELFQSPPPDFKAEGEAVRSMIFAPRRFAEMTREERMRACYQHAVLKYVSGDRMRNSSLRDRLGVEARNAAQISHVIRASLAAKLIKPADPERPQAAYVPYWA